MFSPTRNRIIWAAMLVLLAVLGVQTRDTFDFYFAGVGTLDVRAEPGSDTVFLKWRGKIDAPMASRIAEAFDRHGPGSRKFVLSLSSPGGSLNHGAEVVKLLRRMSATHAIETVVEGRSRCASMCVPVYLQGQRRTAAAGARFMFHEVSFREFHSDEALRVPDAARTVATDSLFKTYFEAAGVPRNWITQVRADMAGGEDVWKTARELVAENAGIVQDLF